MIDLNNLIKDSYRNSFVTNYYRVHRRLFMRQSSEIGLSFERIFTKKKAVGISVVAASIDTEKS